MVSWHSGFEAAATSLVKLQKDTNEGVGKTKEFGCTANNAKRKHEDPENEISIHNHEGHPSPKQSITAECLHDTTVTVTVALCRSCGAVQTDNSVGNIRQTRTPKITNARAVIESQLPRQDLIERVTTNQGASTYLQPTKSDFPRAKKEQLTTADKQYLLNQRVNVWFEKDRKYETGTVLRNQKGKYRIGWDNPNRQTSWESLPKKFKTQDINNPNRWNLVADKN